MSTKRSRNDSSASLSQRLTRRDFIGGTLIGAGATLLSAPCPAANRELGNSWTGFGGVGDYRFSNGNTAEVVSSAHRIRDGAYSKSLREVVETRETFDVVIVGAGFAGMSAAYEFKKANPRGTCLIIDNHPIFGGEAKQNEFDVNGYRLIGPQASNEFVIPEPDSGHPYELWRALDLPDHFEFAKLEGGDPSIHFDKENFAAMFTDAIATIGYFFQNEMTGGKGVWIKNIWEDDLKRAPLPENIRNDLIALRNYETPYQRSFEVSAREEWGPWLDSMTLAEFVTKVIGVKSEALRYADPAIAAGMFGATTDAISAYALAGSSGGLVASRREGWRKTMSFPGGNTVLLRHLVKAVFPDAISGPKRFDAIANNAVNFAALDKPQSKLKMRLGATAIDVSHDGDPTSASSVSVLYEKGGKLHRVRAKGAVLAIGSWVSKHIASDLSANYLDALARIPHGPVLCVNVALHNWRFLNTLGISAARWFEGFGFYANIRRPMLVGDRPTPFHPDKPTVLTFYVPFLRPGLPAEAQGPAGRQELFETSYADFERQIVRHMERLFGGAGFNARRDIAGIVLNRWGHALFTPPPGFFFGKDGKPSPLKVLRERFGRIAFGHSELYPASQAWTTAAAEGKRALMQILQCL